MNPFRRNGKFQISNFKISIEIRSWQMFFFDDAMSSHGLDIIL